MIVCTHTPDFFISLQKKSQEEGGRLQGTDLVKYSRCYRSILHECVLGLRKLARGEHQVFNTNESCDGHLFPKEIM